MTTDNLKELAHRYRLVLASRSPRRYELLKESGISFEKTVFEVVEIPLPNEQPYDFAERMAAEKALTASKNKSNSDKIVLGCDTVVVLDKTILQKPANEQHAIEILSLLSGKQHVVCTALSLVKEVEILAVGHELTRVYFNEITQSRIEEYVKTGEPLDKAGAYGIQGMGAFLVDRIEGKLDNVIGLPRALLNRLAEQVLQLLR